MRAEAGRPHPTGAERAARWRRGGRVFGMACLLAALFLLAAGVGVLPGMGAAASAGAHAASWLDFPTITPLATPTGTVTPTESPTGSPTDTPTPTNTPTPTPTPTPIPQPTLAIISPTSGRGPVGARITVHGMNWGTGSVAIGAATDFAQCAATSAWSASFGTTQAHSNAITETFTWPTSLAVTGTSYTICALGSAGTASASYEVLSASPPTLSLSVASTRVGQNVTIRGASFFGEPTVTLMLSAQSGRRVLATIPPYGDGTFSYTYAPSSSDTGTLTIAASSTPEGGAPPTLQASAVLVVVAAGTPVPTITPTAVVTATVVVDPPPPSRSAGPPLWLLLSGVLVMLFVLLGSLALLIMRQPAPAKSAYPAYPGTGTHAASPSMSQRVTGRFATAGPMGTTGRVPVAEGPGAVAGWDEEPEEPDDSGPGPDWHPRPMGGTHARIPAVESADDADSYAPAEGWEGAGGWAAPYASGYADGPYDSPTRPGTGGPSTPATAAEGDGVEGEREDLGVTRGGDPTRPLDPTRAPPADASPAEDTSPADDTARTNPDHRDEAE